MLRHARRGDATRGSNISESSLDLLSLAGQPRPQITANIRAGICQLVSRAFLRGHGRRFLTVITPISLDGGRKRVPTSPRLIAQPSTLSGPVPRLYRADWTPRRGHAP